MTISPVVASTNSAHISQATDLEKSLDDKPASSADLQQLRKAIKTLGSQLKSVQKNGASTAAAQASSITSQIASLESDVSKITNVGAAAVSSSSVQTALVQAHSTTQRSSESPATKTPTVDVQGTPKSFRLDLTGTYIDTSA